MWILVIGIFCPPLDIYKIKSKELWKGENIVNTQLQLLSQELTVYLQICVYFFFSSQVNSF